MRIVKSCDLPCQFWSSGRPGVSVDVDPLIEQVRQGGDQAVREMTLRFDGVNLAEFRVSDDLLERSITNVGCRVLESIDIAADNIRRFAEKQFECFQSFEWESQQGVWLGQRVIPLDSAGIYVPGGRFPLISSVLMGVIPAQVAGVARVVVCSPPTFNGAIHPAILAAAYRLGAREVYAVGGVQAIAALAYGTESIPSVAKIVGPGNRYVAAAKKRVYGHVGIDFIAGPSEVLIISDGKGRAQWAAADLLAQAEHDPDAGVVLLCPESDFLQQVDQSVQEQLQGLPTAAVATQAIAENGWLVQVADLNEAVEIANRKAPEHLELQVENPDLWINQLNAYGSLFIGEYAVEALGDYSAGLNHTLPTSAAARYTGGLSVKDFIKITTTLRCNAMGALSLAPAAQVLAQAEGLHAHERSVAIRRN